MDGAGILAAIAVNHRVVDRVLAGEPGLRCVDGRAGCGIPGDLATLCGHVLDVGDLEPAVLAGVVEQQIFAVEVVLRTGLGLVEIVAGDNGVAAAGRRRRIAGAAARRRRRCGTVADLHVNDAGVGAAILVHHRVFDGVLALPALQRGVDGRTGAVQRDGGAGCRLGSHGSYLQTAILAGVVEQQVLRVEVPFLVDTGLVEVVTGDDRMAGATAAGRRIGWRRLSRLRRRGTGADL